ncbi:MAG: flagellar biosynthesis regulator FlhF, partial [Deltaproteobacteria bacterium]|nr:flagellar biosynthesis regulator FlhF [Deltaproteobacteria bacterium]
LKRSDHPMPVDIRRNLLQLSVVVDRVTFDILENPAPEKLTMLININRNIAAGLKNS